MKKKLVLVVAVILIAVTACAMLVGCVPNRPDRFVGTWLKSEHKGVVVEIPWIGKMVEAEVGIDGGKMSLKITDTINFIIEEKSSKVNVYTGVYDGLITKQWVWTASTVEKTEADKNNNKQTIDSILNDNEDVKQLVADLQEAFSENFTEKDGWWTANADTKDVVGYKVDGNELLTRVGEVQSPLKLILNYKITIPAEAKDALK